MTCACHEALRRLAASLQHGYGVLAAPWLAGRACAAAARRPMRNLAQNLHKKTHWGQATRRPWRGAHRICRLRVSRTTSGQLSRPSPPPAVALGERLGARSPWGTRTGTRPELRPNLYIWSKEKVQRWGAVPYIDCNHALDRTLTHHAGCLSHGASHRRSRRPTPQALGARRSRRPATPQPTRRATLTAWAPRHRPSFRREAS